VFENWLDEDHEWKLTEGRTTCQPDIYRANKVTPSVTLKVKLNPWELKLIFRALVGRLKDDDDELMAKHLGYTLLKYQLQSEMEHKDYHDRMSQIVTEELEIIEGDMTSLKDKVWEEKIVGGEQ